jgi:hypothetical protein
MLRICGYLCTESSSLLTSRVWSLGAKSVSFSSSESYVRVRTLPNMVVIWERYAVLSRGRCAVLT